jgi:isopentenyl-diphosphate Delta-isomerase
MSYYNQQQYLARVDNENNIIGKIEKWEAHKKGILHRGYTVILTLGENIFLQHRKHPVFDNVFDLSFSSHQMYKDDILQDDSSAIHDGLLREWLVNKTEVEKIPRFLRTIYYKEKDIKSGYIEHEIDYIYHVQLKKIPSFSPHFAYGFTTIKKSETQNAIKLLPYPIAPWVRELLKERLF